MSIFSRLLGGQAQRPEDLDTIQAVAGALDALAAEREAAKGNRQELIERRHAALAADESDAAIKKMDSAIDAVELTLDRLESVEPRLHARLDVLQTAGRRETLGVMRAEYDKIVRDLDAAMQTVIAPMEAFREITSQLDRAGFSNEARGFIVPAPLYGDGILVSPTSLENWRRDRERLSDVSAKIAMGVSVSRPIAPEPPKVVPIRPPAPAPAPASHKKEPLRLAGPIAFGMTRIQCQSNGVDYNGRQCVVGDTFDVTREEASYLLQGTAFRFVAGEEIPTSEAAQ